MSKTWSISEVSRKTNLSAPTLRYYEKIGLINDVQRDSNGYRQYTESNMTWIEFLICMQKTMMPLDDLRRFSELHRQASDLPGRLHIIRAHLERVEEQQRELDKVRQILLKKIGHFEKAIENAKTKARKK